MSLVQQHIVFSLFLVLSIGCNSKKAPTVVAPVASENKPLSKADSQAQGTVALSDGDLKKQLVELASYAREQAEQVASDPSKRAGLNEEAKAKQTQFLALVEKAKQRIASGQLKQEFLYRGREPYEGLVSEGILDFGYVLNPETNAISPSLASYIGVLEYQKVLARPLAETIAEIDDIVTKSKALRQNVGRPGNVSLENESIRLENRLDTLAEALDQLRREKKCSKENYAKLQKKIISTSNILDFVWRKSAKNGK